MPLLPSNAVHEIVPASRGAAIALAIVETSPNLFELAIEAADLEMADITGTGVFELIAAGTSPGSARMTARAAGDDIVVY